MKKIICTLTILALLLSCSVSVYAIECSNADISNVDSNSCSEQYYIKCLSKKLGVSLSEAKKINDRENADVLRSPDEVIKIRTLTTSRRIKNTNNSLYLSVAVKYLYSKTQKRAIEIINIVSPHMYIPGVSSLEITGGDYYIENNHTNGEIIRVCTLSYEATDSYGITVGGDVLNISQTSSNTYKVTTNQITYIMKISLGQLS